MARKLSIQRTDIYRYIRSLQAKAVIFSTMDRPQKYYSLSYREVVDVLVKVKQGALEEVVQKKDHVQSIIDRIASAYVMPAQAGNDGNDNNSSFQLLVGHQRINAKLIKMLEGAKHEVAMVLSSKSLVSLYHKEITDYLARLGERGVAISIQTPEKRAHEYISPSLCPQVSVTTLDRDVPASYVVLDGKKMLVVLEGRTHSFRTAELAGFYTNNMSLVHIFALLFEKLGSGQGANTNIMLPPEAAAMARALSAC
jgi:sugar-specific transcriptional regulator TrmB